ncbi:MAG TPA: hypothetical protein DCX06_02425 [Opitutae bacterium]|nr:hypothetical protein [Opitutae bacterium]
MSEIIIVKAKESAALGPLGAGFAYGFGLFETIKFVEGRLVFWKEHWSRLQASAKFFDMDCSFAEADILRAIRELVEHDGISESMIKLSLLRNAVGTQLFVYARPKADTTESVKLKLETKCPIHPYSMLAGHKTHNYMENMSLFEGARKEGYYDALRLDTLGYLAETTIGNLFFILEGRLCTPSLMHGILPGVVRAEVLKHFDVEEGSYYPDVFERADAVFMTNSGSGLLPVTGLSGAGIDRHFDSVDQPFLADVRSTLAGLERDSSVRIDLL